MASTLTNLLYHAIWSNKDRAPLIKESIEVQVWRMIAAVAARNEIQALKVGGIEDHIHLLMRLPKTMSVSEAMQRIKGASAKFINDERLMESRFGWQDGYGAFTVSASAVPEATSYIARQWEHHRNRSFQEEFLEFIRKHGIEYDERYLWG